MGLGILLASVFLGIIILYLRTQNSWKWKTILKRALIGIGIVISVILVGLVALFAYEKWQQRPKVVTSLNGVALGERFSDVVFRRGSFAKLSPNRNIARRPGDNDEHYRQTETRMLVSVRNGVVSAITYACNKNEYDYTRVNNIGCGASGEDIVQAFGKRVRILCSKKTSEGSEFVRVYDVVAYGTRHLMRLNRVERFYVTDQKDLDSLVGINWDKCE